MSPSPTSVAETLASVGRPVAADVAEAIASAVAFHGSLDVAIGAAADAFAPLSDLLGYQTALAEAADPAALALRLTLNAANHAEMADRHRDSAAELTKRRSWASVRDSMEARRDLENRIAAALSCEAMCRALASEALAQAAHVRRTGRFPVVAVARAA